VKIIEMIACLSEASARQLDVSDLSDDTQVRARFGNISETTLWLRASVLVPNATDVLRQLREGVTTAWRQSGALSSIARRSFRTMPVAI